MKNLIIQINEQENGGTVEVNLFGNLCGMDAVRMKTTVIQVMDGIHQDLVINLSDLSSIDLKGINSLAAIYRFQAAKECSAIFLHRFNSNVMASIRPTKMDRVLPFSYEPLAMAG